MSLTNSPLAVHLTANTPVTRDNISRAYALNEPDLPSRDMTDPNTKVKSIQEIIDWLDVEESARYQRTGSSTFCNIYAYDYCYLNGAYLPRVWWNQDALEKVRSGQDIRAVYETTVHELNANALYDWFEAFGEEFGWAKTDDVNQLQHSANYGLVAIIVAKRTNTGRSGHITAVVPEIGDFRAKRDENGQVIIPVESQAGAYNYEYVVKSNQWWMKEKFSHRSFWVHQ